MNFNKIVIVGRLGRDPELKALPSGNSVCSFSVATSRAWKDKEGEKQEEVEWHNVVFWNKPAEIIAQYVKKGSLLLVEGHLKTRTYEKEGVTMYRTEIMGENFQLPPRNTSGGSQEGGYMDDDSEAPAKKPAGKKKVDSESGVNPEDIPF